MIHFCGVCISFERPVIRNLDVHIQRGAHVAFMGPSGCGKTSLLRTAAGLLTPTSGSIYSASDRISYAFQEPRLLPWLSAKENIKLVLTGEDRDARAMEYLTFVHLEESYNKMPSELSGGMRQRLNLARALAYNGDILLLDEPTASLDKSLQEDILSLLRTQSRDKTVLLSTHNPREAEILCDVIYTYQENTFDVKRA